MMNNTYIVCVIIITRNKIDTLYSRYIHGVSKCALEFKERNCLGQFDVVFSQENYYEWFIIRKLNQMQQLSLVDF